MDELTLELLTADFRKKGMPSPEEAAKVFIREYSPTIVKVPTEDDDSYTVDITHADGASLISCVIGGDRNVYVHSGENGIVHTPMRIGDYAHVISKVHPGALLREIRNIRFIGTIPLGSTVRITAKKKGEEKPDDKKSQDERPNKRRALVHHLVTGVLAATNKVICRETTVTTIKPEE